MLSETADAAEDVHATSSVRLVDLEKLPFGGSCGFHLTRSRWDPYPWVSKVDPDSPADVAGVRPGDCILEINGEDIVGKRISEVADRVRSGLNQVSLLLWNSGSDPQCTPESLCCGPMTQNLQRLSVCMSTILTALECPVCLDTIPPPVYQCENGHLTCLRCRAKSERCPVCRIRLSRGRSLLAEQAFEVITEVFQLKDAPEQMRRAKMRKIFKMKDHTPNAKVSQSHANKFLARLIGKSTSVDNLSSNGSVKSTIPAIQISLDQDFESNLKAKSLSSSEIFRCISPAGSRAGSFYQLNGNSRLAGQKFGRSKTRPESSPSSCHGSFESLDRKLKEECLARNVLAIPDEEVLYQCPYDPKCCTTIKGPEMFRHFRTTHEGPLVQYFQPRLRLPLANIDLQKNPCYVINIEETNFFLRILDVSDHNRCKAFLMWAWFLGDLESSNKFQLQMKLVNQEEEVLLGFTGAVYSLEKVSWKTVVESRKGIFLNHQTLEALGSSKSDTFLDFEVCQVETEDSR